MITLWKGPEVCRLWPIRGHIQDINLANSRLKWIFCWICWFRLVDGEEADVFVVCTSGVCDRLPGCLLRSEGKYIAMICLKHVKICKKNKTANMKFLKKDSLNIPNPTKKFLYFPILFIVFLHYKHGILKKWFRKKLTWNDAKINHYEKSQNGRRLHRKSFLGLAASAHSQKAFENCGGSYHGWGCSV